MIYLKDLRDLEVANWKIDRLLEDKERLYKQNDKYYSTVTYYDLPDKSKYSISDSKKQYLRNNLMFYISLIIILMSLIWIFLGFRNVIINQDEGFMFLYIFTVPIAIVSLILSGGWFLSKISDKSYYKNQWNQAIAQYESDLKKYKQMNEQERVRTKDFPNKIAMNYNNWIKEKEFFEGEKKKVQKLLHNLYNINIIPTPYRNLESIYYIYDYMASSQQSLEQTLLHERMENGIKRLSCKIDTVIKQNERIIFNTRRIAEGVENIGRKASLILEDMDHISNEVDSISANSTQILESCRNTERNSEIAAQYSQIAAKDAEAIAYFSLANYLRN